MHKSVSLFVPCLVDQVLPEIGLATARVLRKSGFEVHYDRRQTCCGQPAFNAGHWDEARHVAEHFIDVFKVQECIVSPSGSCTAMVRKFYPELFPKRNGELNFTNGVFEFSEFLIKEKVEFSASSNAKVSIHTSCHSMRELGIVDEIEKVLEKVAGIQIVQPEREHICCGFGGLFSFKFSPIAETMAKTRLGAFSEIDCDAVIVNDPGCIMHMRQQAKKQGFRPQILHLAEFLDQVMK